ncbi:peptidoglycan-binding protein LysM [Deltaproteobacteria bacterium]|nr:peptidoglycan-binding protein LysM [Deltaproteobacteria bacterium]
MLAALILATLTPAAFAQEGMVQMGGTAATPDFYTIQAGDTLWDISTRFLGDPYQWPQLWSYNEYITNPHWIYPGNRVYFHLGDALTPPGASVEPIVDVPYQPPQEVVATNDSDCDFPAKFDSEATGQQLVAPAILGTAKDINARGRVIAASAPGTNLAEGTYVYLKLDDTDGVECGTLFNLYRKVGGAVKGAGAARYVYRIVSTVRVIRVDDGVATAEIRDSFVETTRSDIVGDALPAEVTVDVAAPEGDVDARIIARLNVDMANPTVYETVFIDRGTNDGVDVGTSLYLVTQKDGLAPRGAKPDTRLPERVTGRVVVVRADETQATAVVVNASEEFSTGARVVGTPNRQE